MNIKTFYQASMTNKLLTINVAVYLLITIFGLFVFLMGAPGIGDILAMSFLGLPADLGSLPARFYTPITYMFTHTSFWHILGNMLWLYFMGQMFLMIYNSKQMFATYILGGLAGGLFYILCFNVFPVFAMMKTAAICIGASASVTAIVIAICVASPNTEIRIFGILPLTLKWLGIIYIIFDVLQIQSSNAGGHLAHLGGAIFGFMFAYMMKKGKDITAGFNNLIDKIVTMLPSKTGSARKSTMHVSYKNTQARTAKDMTDAEFNQQKAADQQKVDEILDKISKTGYNNLTKEEKEFLFKMSKR